MQLEEAEFNKVYNKLGPDSTGCGALIVHGQAYRESKEIHREVRCEDEVATGDGGCTPDVFTSKGFQCKVQASDCPSTRDCEFIGTNAVMAGMDRAFTAAGSLPAGYTTTTATTTRTGA